MSRPLLITDCDEVLLHMVSHFRDWVAQAHDVNFAVDSTDFSGALTILFRLFPRCPVAIAVA